MTDTFFEDALIFITEYNSNGAAGYVVNKPYGRSLNELEEFRHSTFFDLYHGGPVDEEHLFFLHRRPDIISGGVLLTDDIYFGGNFSEAVTAINNKTLTKKDLKIFVGYCGWDAGELDAELEEGSWVVEPKNTTALFS